MKSEVMIKSFQNGISLCLDDSAEFEDILEETAVKFGEARHFFKDARMALSIEGRELTTAQEKQLIETICSNSELSIICLVGKDAKRNQTYVKAVQQVNKRESDVDGQFYKGTLHKGQTLETEHSIIVIGDVEAGASVISKKDIIIIGSLHGDAYAGAGGSDTRFVVALDMSPDRLRIGDLTYIPSQKNKWLKSKAQPRAAYIKDGIVTAQPITKELLNQLPL